MRGAGSPITQRKKNRVPLELVSVSEQSIGEQGLYAGKNLPDLYTNATAVPYLGTTLGHHIVLNYIDAGGNHHTLQEHPFQHNLDKAGAFLQEEVLSDGKNNTDSRFGRLLAREDKDEGKDRDISLDQPHTLVAEGDDLSPQWALMRDFADEVNTTGYEYRSNTAGGWTSTNRSSLRFLTLLHE
jgi:hypothetical protein